MEKYLVLSSVSLSNHGSFKKGEQISKEKYLSIKKYSPGSAKFFEKVNVSKEKATKTTKRVEKKAEA